jgi:hypothetical protein
MKVEVSEEDLELLTQGLQSNVALTDHCAFDPTWDYAAEEKRCRELFDRLNALLPEGKRDTWPAL